MSATATGKVCSRMPDRVTMSTEPASMSLAADFWTASADMWSSLSRIRRTFMSLGDTQGMLPSDQNEASSLDGVPPPDQRPSEPSDARDQLGGFMPRGPRSSHPQFP